MSSLSTAYILYSAQGTNVPQFVNVALSLDSFYRQVDSSKKSAICPRVGDSFFRYFSDEFVSGYTEVSNDLEEFYFGC